ncbi:aminoacyl-tRNA hydrolase [Clavibacter tessellarius]|uniref:aminoacyl-tRNA hydrolase n=1 Tax=Clavibacter tessellarius TaxID=31965 RepID=UPI003247B70A
MDDRTLLVVGLGNPGPQYAGTRHNVGQMALDVLADRMRATFRSHRANAQVAEGRAVPGGPKLILAKPSSFMNLSGGPVANLLKYFSLEASQLVVAHDESRHPVRRDEAQAGRRARRPQRDPRHHLLRRDGDFMRVRIGIGRPPGRQDAADFVLKPFSSTERQVLPNVLEDAADAIEMIASDGLIAAQLRFHTAAS